MILSEHAFKPEEMAINLLKSFLALLNLRPLGYTFLSIMYDVGSWESDASARDS